MGLSKRGIQKLNFNTKNENILKVKRYYLSIGRSVNSEEDVVRDYSIGHGRPSARENKNNNILRLSKFKRIILMAH